MLPQCLAWSCGPSSTCSSEAWVGSPIRTKIKKSTVCKGAHPHAWPGQRRKDNHPEDTAWGLAKVGGFLGLGFRVF